MATTTKKKKKPFKGKYEGPDELKGDKAKLAIWRAAKRQAANPAPPKAPDNPPEAPTDQTQAPQTQAPVGADANGGLGLQSNIDIETQVMDAEEAKKQAISEAARLKSEADIEARNAKLQAAVMAEQARGRTNASAAYRGLKGTTALKKVEETESGITATGKAIEDTKASKEAYAEGLVTSADEYYRNKEKWAAGERLKYTGEQSRNNPTAGTNPSNAGVSAPKPSDEMNPLKDSGTSSVATASKSYKGKYKGPDVFKGDKALNAAWKAAAKRRAKKGKK